MLTEKNRDEFYKVADSLKRFKRAEIKDSQERSLIDTLYTDLLPENQVYKMVLSDNTTFLIGRKGTGKSTIILRLESEYRKKDDYIPCYIDTKTVFESTKSDYQNLDYLTGEILSGVTEILQQEKFDWVLVQGDTTSTMAGAMAAFYQKIQIGHVEAGLRTFNLKDPFPEELNRQITSKMSTLHFAPTEKSYQNLLNEGVPKETVHITGNTIIDALQWVLKNVPEPEVSLEFADTQQRMILVTGHRRENFGEKMKKIFEEIETLAIEHHELEFIFPMHPNPNVQQLKPILKHVNIIDTLDYSEMMQLLSKVKFVISDSGGIQEECASFNKKILVCRNNTERPEGVNAGFAKVIGTDVTKVEESKGFIEKAKYHNMDVSANFMKSYAMNPKEFAQKAIVTQKFGTDILCIVDSAGGMLTNEMEDYFHAVQDVCDIPIGLHGHNNLELAVSNSIRAAIISAWCRM